MFKIKKIIKSEQGISLIEVVASIVIIGIILISFFGFFINSAKFNSKNDANIQAASIAREYTAKFNNGELYDGEWKPGEWGFTETTDIPKQYIQTFDEERSFEKDNNTIKKKYIVEVSISAEVESGDFYKDLRKVYIAVWEETKSGNPLSDTYTFQESPKTTN